MVETIKTFKEPPNLNTASTKKHSSRHQHRKQRQDRQRPSEDNLKLTDRHKAASARPTVMLITALAAAMAASGRKVVATTKMDGRVTTQAVTYMGSLLLPRRARGRSLSFLVNTRCTQVVSCLSRQLIADVTINNCIPQTVSLGGP